MLKIIFKTQFYTLSIQVLNVLILFIFLQYLDKSIYGEYVLYQGNLALFLLLFSQNLYIYTRLKISGAEDLTQFSYLKTSFLFIICGIVFTFLIIFFLSLWFNVFDFFGLNNYIFQFILVATFEVLINEFIRFFLATKEINKRNNLQLIQRLSFFILFVFTILLLDLKICFEQILLLLFIAQLVSLSYALSNIKLRVFIQANLFIKEFILKAYKTIIPFLPIAFSTTIINYTDRFLINKFLNINSLAEYGVIIQIISMSNMLIGMSVILPVFPFAVESYNLGKFDESFNFFKKMMNIGLLFAMIFSLFFVVNYDWFLNLIGNGKYKQSDVLVSLMSFNPVFYVIITSLSHYFQVVKKIKIVIFISVFSMILNILLNFYLIPLFGIIGSAFSSMFTLFLMSISLSIYGLTINSDLFKSFYLKSNIFTIILHLILISLLLYFINILFPDKILFIILKNIIGISYFVLIGIFFYKEDLMKFKNKFIKNMR